jgi:hypothetical protein
LRGTADLLLDDGDAGRASGQGVAFAGQGGQLAVGIAADGLGGGGIGSGGGLRGGEVVTQPGEFGPQIGDIEPAGHQASHDRRERRQTQGQAGDHSPASIAARQRAMAVT